MKILSNSYTTGSGESTSNKRIPLKLNLPNGIYLINAKNKDEWITEKFIVK